jgi:hypothetical protein
MSVIPGSAPFALIVAALEQFARERSSVVARRLVLGRAYPLDEVGEFVVGQLAEVLLDAETEVVGWVHLW